MLPDSAGSRPPSDPGAVAELGLSVDVQVATGPRVLPWLRRRVRLQRRAQQKLTMDVSPRIDHSHARRTTHATLSTYASVPDPALRSHGDARCDEQRLRQLETIAVRPEGAGVRHTDRRPRST